MNHINLQSSRDSLLAATLLSLEIENRQIEPARTEIEADPYRQLLKNLDRKPNAREIIEAFSAK